MAADRDHADQEAGSTALVVVDKLRQKMDELYGSGDGSRKSHARTSNEGYDAGKQAHIPTARPVSATSQRLLA